MRVDDVNGEKILVKTSFTSLVKIPEWTFDVQNAIRSAEKAIEDDDGVYT